MILSESDINQRIGRFSINENEGFRIVNGYGLGFGNEVLAGALSQLKVEHKPIDGYLFMRPFL